MVTRSGQRMSVAALCALTACGEPGGGQGLRAPARATPVPAVAAAPRDRAPAPPPPVRERPPAVAPQATEPPGPVLTPTLLRERAHAQQRILGDELIEDARGEVVSQGPAPLRENGNALGRFVPIENEGALSAFHEALQRYQRQAPGAPEKLRIAAFGASHTQGDFYTGYLRYYLQQRFGNGGQGFVQMAQINQWYRLLDTRVESEGFQIQHAQRTKTPPLHGRFGLAGAAAVGRFPSSFARIKPLHWQDPDRLAQHYDLFYGIEPDAGTFELRLNGGPVARIATAAERPRSGFYSFNTELGWHTLEARPLGDGPVRLFGVAVERPGRGVVVDTLGISGTRASNQLTWDLDLLREQLERRNPKLVMLAYGTNESTDLGQTITTYETQLKDVLVRLQAITQGASCLLIGPGDFPRRKGSNWRPRPRLLQIIEVQRAMAYKLGCGFWDAYAFMGGEGSMDRWVRALPAMGAPDHTHLTPRGYVRMGMALGDALMRRFDEQALLQSQSEDFVATLP